MTRLSVFSDLHYYSASLGITGKAYSLRESSDQKCLKETGAILGSLTRTLADSDCDAVCIAGDITNNGERVCHEEAVSLLDRLNEKKPVFPLTSTHDWSSNGHAFRYEGENRLPYYDTVKKEELPAIYGHFGREYEVSRYLTSAGQYSASFRLNGEVLIIMINDDCDGRGGSSGYGKEHLTWIKQQLVYARANGLWPVAFEHHLLLDSVSPLVNGGQKIADAKKNADALADAGLRLIITGHSHFQRISTHISPSGNRITQLNAGSVSGYPGVITEIAISDGKAVISEKPFAFFYEGSELDGEYLKRHTLGLLTRLLSSAADDYADFTDILYSNGIHIPGIKVLRPVVSAAAKKIVRATVPGAAKKINRLCRGALDMSAAAQLADKPLTEIIENTFLNLFYGSGAEKTAESEKTLVAGFAKIPGRIIGKLPLPEKNKAKALDFADRLDQTLTAIEYPEKIPEYIEL